MNTTKLNQIKSIRTALKDFAGRDRGAMSELKKELREFEIAVMNNDELMVAICETGVAYWFHALATS